MPPIAARTSRAKSCSSFRAPPSVAVHYHSCSNFPRPSQRHQTELAPRSAIVRVGSGPPGLLRSQSITRFAESLVRARSF